MQKYEQADSVRQKYAGMETDEGSNNSHTLWRKYDHSSGRWTSPDPYNGSMTVGDPQSFNRYTYVQNDPVNLVDPAGLMPSDIGVFQTDDPEDAKIAGQQSLRDLQTSVNANYASRHGGSVSYDSNRASFTSAAKNTQRQWLAEAVEAAIAGNSTFTGAVEDEETANDSAHAQNESGDFVQVIIWSGYWKYGPVTAFGHVSFVIDGMSYSWQGHKDKKTGKQIWFTVYPAELYISEKQEKASGVGFLLDFGSRAANRKFAGLLVNAYEGKGGYNLTNNNCGHAFRRAINAMRLPGVPLNKGVRPGYHMDFIQNKLTRYIKAEYEYPKGQGFQLVRK